MSAEPLSAADRGSLQAERGPVNMAVAGLMVFERAGRSDWSAVMRARVRERLHLVPRYRQRLEDPAFGIANPVWVDDEAFDLDWHLRHARLPEPTQEALAAYVAGEMSRRLDRTRPLWELHVIEGLAGDRVALLPKMHHALVDGVAAVGIGMVLLDPTPEPLEIEPPPEGWRPRGFDRRRHLFSSVARGSLGRAQRLVLDSTARVWETSPRQAATDLRRATELATELARQRPQAPMTPLNDPISPNRAFAMRSCELPVIKAAGKAAGGTVNDVVLATVAGTLDRFLAAAGTDLRGREPVALVPVSVRRDDDPEGGNRISTVFVDLPVGLPDLADRIAAVAATMADLRGSAAVRAGAVLVGASGIVPPLVGGVLVRAMGSVRAMNLVVSNVPGPQQPFYIAGARMLEVVPAVPLNPANQGLSVGVLSYDGSVGFGLLADARLRPGLDVVAAALDEALAEVQVLAAS